MNQPLILRSKMTGEKQQQNVYALNTHNPKENNYVQTMCFSFRESPKANPIQPKP